MNMRRMITMVFSLGMAALLAGCGSLAGKGAASGDNLAYQAYKPSDYVTLGEYKGLKVTQTNPKEELTQEEQKQLIADLLDGYGEEQEITGRTSQEGDYLGVYYSYYEDDELQYEATDEETSFCLGSGEFDELAEPLMTGLAKGDKKTVEYVTDIDEESTVTCRYELEVLRLYTLVYPELNDEIAQELGYESAAECLEIESQNAIDMANDDSATETSDQIMEALNLSCEIKEFPDGLYESTKEAMDEMYSTFFGVTLEDMYEGDEDAVRETVENSMRPRLILEAIAQKEGITVTKDELQSYKETIVADYDYASMEDLEADYSDADLVDQMLQDKVTEFLLQNADITYLDADEDFE